MPSFELLNSLIEEALRANPSIQAARREWAAATKRPSQVSSLPNPEINFGSMSSGNPLPYSTIGGGPLDWASFMFLQKIPWPGKLDLKRGIAETEVKQKAEKYRAATLQVIRRLKEAYFELHYISRSEEILRRYRDLLDKFARIAEARYSVGQGIQADVLRSQVEISLLEERLEVLTERRETAEALVNSLLNRSPDSLVPPVPAVVDSAVQELPFSLERLYLMARRQNPEIDAGRIEIQKAALKLDLAKKELRPDFSLSASYLLRGGPFDNMYEYRLGLELPLYFWRKERLGVEENMEELQRARHSYQSSLQEVTFQIKESYIGARTSHKLIRLYRGGIIPQATAALDSALSAYEVGTVDFLNLVDNTLTILNYELQYQQEIGDYFQNLARLEELLDAVLLR
ncbi:MAG: TolC family protein [Acidobacteria bacterium]|nr:TolC family protein [Acidobacteriota bacterium]